MPIINWISVWHEDGETEQNLSSVAACKDECCVKIRSHNKWSQD